MRPGSAASARLALGARMWRRLTRGARADERRIRRAARAHGREQIARAGSATRACSRRWAACRATSSCRPSERGDAYDDRPLPIGDDQTISQPYIVALMTEAAAARARRRACSRSAPARATRPRCSPRSRARSTRSRSSSRSPTRAQRDARAARLRRNVHLRTGDGYRGWPEAAPFDAILVTAAPAAVPPRAARAARAGGRLVIPVGEQLRPGARGATRRPTRHRGERLFPVASCRCEVRAKRKTPLCLR